MARWISNHGHQNFPYLEPVGWEHARNEKAVIISKDEDFVDRWLLSEAPVALIWIRKGTCSNQVLIAWLGPLWPEALKRLEQGERLIELRG